MSSNPPLSCPKKGGLFYPPLLFIFLFFTYPPSLFSSNLFKYQQITMGTVVEIALFGHDEEPAQKAAPQAFHEMKRVERLMSPWFESGDVSRINRSAGKESVKVSSETIEVLKKAHKVYELSGGGFDITVGPLVQLWRKARERDSS